MKNARGNSFYSKLKQFNFNAPLNFLNHRLWGYSDIPYLKGNPFLGRLNYVLTEDGNINNLLSAGKLASEHPSGMCYYWLAHKLVLIITKPNDIKELLISNDSNISRRSVTRFVELFWGPNIISDPREIWKKKKTIYTQHLGIPEALKKCEKSMHLISDKYLQKIQCEAKRTINLRELLSDYTLETILSIMIPPDETRDISIYKNYMSYISDNVVNVKNLFKWGLPPFLRRIFYKHQPTDVTQVKEKMHKMFDDLILCPYGDHIKNSDNFLHFIGQVRNEQNEPLCLKDNKDIFGDSNALFFAAQDTVTSTFEFTIKSIATHPEIKEKLYEALDYELNGKEFTMENINKVTYLEMIIKEVLRLYPPSGIFPRMVDKSFTLNKLPLARGTIVLLSPYLTHRRPELWPYPEQFNPERFSKSNSSKILPHSYIPFGDGRHGCVGWRFAQQQLKMFLAAIYLRYDVEVIDNDFELTFYRTTLKPKKITSVRFIPR